MNKSDLARRLAHDSKRTHAQAADALDTLVYHLLKDLRPGKPATGAGRVVPSKPKDRA